MKTPEGKLKDQIKSYLRSIGVYYFMPVQSGYGATSVDFLCCIRGRFVAIEAKAPGGVATARQDLVMSAVHKAGGLAFATDSLERTRRYIQDHCLDEYTPEAD